MKKQCATILLFGIIISCSSVEKKPGFDAYVGKWVQKNSSQNIIEIYSEGENKMVKIYNEESIKYSEDAMYEQVAKFTNDSLIVEGIPGYAVEFNFELNSNSELQVTASGYEDGIIQVTIYERHDQIQSTSQTATSGDDKVNVAREIMAKKVSGQSKGKLELVEFSKTNGIEREYMGAKYYELNYNMTITVKSPGYICIDHIMNEKPFKRGYDSEYNFYVKDTKGKCFGENELSLSPGQMFNISSQITLEKAENGWRE